MMSDLLGANGSNLYCLYGRLKVNAEVDVL